MKSLEKKSVLNPNSSIITAGFPSGSMKHSHLTQPQSTTKYDQYLNQNRAIDIISDSQPNDSSHHTIATTNQTLSDTYLNLSRKDINDVMKALCTLTHCIQNDIYEKYQQSIIAINEGQTSPMTMLYSKSTNHALKSSTQANVSSHDSVNNQYLLSSSQCLNHHRNRHHHCHRRHTRCYQNLVDDFHHDLHRTIRNEQCHQKYVKHHNPSSYPSYSSNAILYTSTHRSNMRPRRIHQYTRQDQSIKEISLENPEKQSINNKASSSKILSPCTLDNIIYIDQNEPYSHMQRLPQQVHALQILHNNQVHNAVSVESLANRHMIIPSSKFHHLSAWYCDQVSGMGDQNHFNKNDVSTQWSSQVLSSPAGNTKQTINCDDLLKTLDEDENLKLQLMPTNSLTLTELSQSITTLVTNDSNCKTPIICQKRSLSNNSFVITDPYNTKEIINIDDKRSEQLPSNENNELRLTKSETERFLTTLDMPICKCSNTKLQPSNLHKKHLPFDDNVICISIDNNSSVSSSSSTSSLLNGNIDEAIPIKPVLKRAHRRRMHTSKNNQTVKRSRTNRRTRSNNQSMDIIQASKTINPKEYSFFDFFDIDTTFSDAYDQLFSDTLAISE